MSDLLNYKFKDAKKYSLNSSVQYTAATHLLNQFTLNGDEQILDIGCGDGKITYELAKLIPHGFITGIDISEAMILYAKNKFPHNKHSNLEFKVQDAKDLRYNQQFNLIFSSFAIQWIVNLENFFSRVFRALQIDGIFAATLPLGISTALEQAIYSTINSSNWKKYFKNISLSEALPKKEIIQSQLENSPFSTTKISTQILTTHFCNRKKFADYVEPWFPFFKYIPNHLRGEFFDLIITRYFDFEPCMDDRVLFQFPVLNILATKDLS